MSPMWLYIVSFLAVANLVASQSIIKNLPGFSGDLPFKLETGYVGVGDLDEVQLFYYFIESERSPEDDPLVLWLNGGPGCSALSGLMYEIEIGLEKVVFEGDSETITKAINVDSHGLASFGHIVVDVKDLAMNLVASSFSHVKRKGNAVADRLAKLARHFLSSHFLPGPFTFDYANSKTYSPKLKLNPYSWTKVANIIFVDTPVGSGFSYAKTSEGYYISDTLAAAELYEFLRKWLKVHPKFLTNTLYVMGDSYSGIIIPILVQEISDGNKAGREPRMNLKGYVIGNPVTNTHVDLNERIPFAHLKALISDELYEVRDFSWIARHGYSFAVYNNVANDLILVIRSTKKDCKGEYMIVDPSNAACVDDLKVYTECIEKIVTQHILEPTCQLLYPKPRPRVSKWDPDTPIEDSAYLLQSITHLPEPRRWCRQYNYLYSYIWANDKTVQKALHVREGSINEWVRCNESLVYTYDVTSSLNYHRNLIKKGYEVLIYSGDHDMVIPYISTHAWIESLNLTIAHDWRPWFVDGQVAGFTMQYTFKKYCLTFATVKGGGHTAPEYKPNECLAMVDRWLSYYPL